MNCWSILKQEDIFKNGEVSTKSPFDIVGIYMSSFQIAQFNDVIIYNRLLELNKPNFTLGKVQLLEKRQISFPMIGNPLN